MKEVIRIPYPKTAAGKKQWNQRYGLNAYYSGKHWSKRKEDATYWHMLTRSAMNKQKTRRIPFEKPVVISFLWNDRLDCSNHAVMGKMIEDALKGRVIRDDSQKWVRGVEHYFHEEECIKIIIREVGEE